MKRMIISAVLGGIVATLIFAGIDSRGGRPGLVAKVHGEEGCSVASLRGTYGFYRHGTTGVATTMADELGAVGIFTADGAGNIVAPGHQQTSKNGIISDFNGGVGIGGTYQVNPDCTGQSFVQGAAAPFANFVIIDGGKGLYALSQTPSNAVIEVATRTQPLE